MSIDREAQVRLKILYDLAKSSRDAASYLKILKEIDQLQKQISRWTPSCGSASYTPSQQPQAMPWASSAAATAASSFVGSRSAISSAAYQRPQYVSQQSYQPVVHVHPHVQPIVNVTVQAMPGMGTMPAMPSAFGSQMTQRMSQAAINADHMAVGFSNKGTKGNAAWVAEQMKRVMEQEGVPYPQKKASRSKQAGDARQKIIEMMGNRAGTQGYKPSYLGQIYGKILAGKMMWGGAGGFGGGWGADDFGGAFDLPGQLSPYASSAASWLARQHGVVTDWGAKHIGAAEQWAGRKYSQASGWLGGMAGRAATWLGNVDMSMPQAQGGSVSPSNILLGMLSGAMNTASTVWHGGQNGVVLPSIAAAARVLGGSLSEKDTQQRGYLHNMRLAKGQLAAMGVEDIWGTNLSTSASMRSEAAKNPELFGKKLSHIQNSLEGAAKLAGDNTKAITSINQKLIELAKLKADMAALQAGTFVPAQGSGAIPVGEYTAVTPRYKKKGARAANVKIAADILAKGGSHADAVKALMDEGYAESTASGYAREAARGGSKGLMGSQLFGWGSGRPSQWTIKPAWQQSLEDMFHGAMGMGGNAIDWTRNKIGDLGAWAQKNRGGSRPIMDAIGQLLFNGGQRPLGETLAEAAKNWGVKMPSARSLISAAHGSPTGMVATLGRLAGPVGVGGGIAVGGVIALDQAAQKVASSFEILNNSTLSVAQSNRKMQEEWILGARTAHQLEDAIAGVNNRIRVAEQGSMLSIGSTQSWARGVSGIADQQRAEAMAQARAEGMSSLSLAPGHFFDRNAPGGERRREEFAIRQAAEDRIAMAEANLAGSTAAAGAQRGRVAFYNRRVLEAQVGLNNSLGRFRNVQNGLNSPQGRHFRDIHPALPTLTTLTAWALSGDRQGSINANMPATNARPSAIEAALDVRNNSAAVQAAAAQALREQEHLTQNLLQMERDRTALGQVRVEAIRAEAQIEQARANRMASDSQAMGYAGRGGRRQALRAFQRFQRLGAERASPELAQMAAQFDRREVDRQMRIVGERFYRQNFRFGGEELQEDWMNGNSISRQDRRAFDFGELARQTNAGVLRDDAQRAANSMAEQTRLTIELLQQTYEAEMQDLRAKIAIMNASQ